MRLFKIGRSQSCDIVLNSQLVSSLHAELTILDDGQIILEDKGSTNGTVVGKNRINPGEEITIQRGDRVNFADEPLVWAKVPAAERLTDYKQIYNIGTNYRNDIIVNNQTVSRYHASLRIGKDNKAYLHDNGGVNGTLINGVKMKKGETVRIKRGDNIVCGAEDITDQITPLIPKGGMKKIISIIGGVAVVAVIGVLVALFWPKPPVSINDIRTGVVYVNASFHYVVTFKDNPMPGEWDGKFEDIESVQPYFATAFFLDRNGYMGTNRHVAVPWEYRTDQDDSRIRKDIEERLTLAKIAYGYKSGEIDVETLEGNVQKKYEDFIKTDFCQSILTHVLKSNNPKGELLNILNRLNKGTYDISGEIDEITVGYAGKYYTHYDEFQRCNVIAESGNEDVDVAILQLNNKRTPDDVKFVFDPLKSFEGTLVPLKDKLGVIGYPAGLHWGRDDKTKSLEPTIRETKCSKEPGKYEFEFQANSVGGSSGSPVYNEQHQLVGILCSGYQIAGGASMAVHAKFLKKMYEEEVGIK